MISPMNPNRAPHTDSESRRIAGLRPMALPMIFGVMIISMMICTMMKMATADARLIQEFCQVSAAFSRARKAVGIKAKVCR